MARIELAAKAFLAAFREFRGTLIGMLLLGALVVWLCDLNTTASYVIGALAGYLPGFLAAYEKAYAELRSLDTPRTASARPRPAPASPDQSAGTPRRIGHRARWVIIRWVSVSIATLVGLWLLFNLVVVIYR